MHDRLVPDAVDQFPSDPRLHRRHQPQPQARKIRRQHRHTHEEAAETLLPREFVHEVQVGCAIRTADLNLLELPIQLQSAQAVYQQKLAQYRAGVSDLIDLTNATFVLYRSQTDYAENVADWYLAQLDRAAAIGSLDSFVNSVR